MISIKKLVIILLTFLVTIVAIFVALPSAVNLLGFSGEQFFGGEVWRILTFPLTHATSAHLIENVVALFIVSLLMLEFKLSTKDTAYLFMGSSVLVAFVVGLILPSVIIVGASLGLYALYGGLTIRGKEYVPLYITWGLIGIVIFLNFVYCIKYGTGLEQPIFHTIGFVAGVTFLGVKDKLKRKKRIFK